MQSNSSQSRVAESESTASTSQPFSQWLKERRARYHATEQETSKGIAEVLQTAGELMSSVEQEMTHRLQQGQQQHRDMQHQLESLRHALQNLRNALAREREEHNRTLARERDDAEAEIERQHQDTLKSGERLVEETRAACEQMIREATTEFDQVRGETQHWIKQLATLQQTLQPASDTPNAASGKPDTADLDTVSPEHIETVPPSLSPTLEPANQEEPAESAQEESTAPDLDVVAPAYMEATSPALSSTEEPSTQKEPDTSQEESTVPHIDTVAAAHMEAASPALSPPLEPVMPEEPASQAPPTDAQAEVQGSQEYPADKPSSLSYGDVENEVPVVIESVENFVTALTLIERIKKIPSIDHVRLQSYSQMILTVGIGYTETEPLEDLLVQHFGEAMAPVAREEEVIRLFYRD